MKDLDLQVTKKSNYCKKCLRSLSVNDLKIKLEAVLFQPLDSRSPYYIEKNQLMLSANQSTGFDMIKKLVVNGLKIAQAIALRDHFQTSLLILSEF